MAMTRRRFLQAVGALGVALGAPLLTVVFWRGRQAAPSVPSISPANAVRGGPFPYLNLAPDVLETFEADYRRHAGRLPARDRWSERVQAQLLLSTDFFRFDGDEARVISYVGFYDATVTPCNNPLARFD